MVYYTIPQHILYDISNPFCRLLCLAGMDHLPAVEVLPTPGTPWSSTMSP